MGPGRFAQRASPLTPKAQGGCSPVCGSVQRLETGRHPSWPCSGRGSERTVVGRSPRPRVRPARGSSCGASPGMVGGQQCRELSGTGAFSSYTDASLPPDSRCSSLGWAGAWGGLRPGGARVVGCRVPRSWAWGASGSSLSVAWIERLPRACSRGRSPDGFQYSASVVSLGSFPVGPTSPLLGGTGNDGRASGSKPRATWSRPRLSHRAAPGEAGALAQHLDRCSTGAAGGPSWGG